MIMGAIIIFLLWVLITLKSPSVGCLLALIPTAIIIFLLLYAAR